MAMNPGLLTAWPWERLGNLKYCFYLPLIANAIHTSFGISQTQNFSFHILVITALRYIQGQLWMTVTRLHDLVSKHRVQEKGIKFEQLDREKNWEDFLLFQALFLHIYYKLQLLPEVHPFWDWRGLFVTLFWHIGPVEFIYYWFHRLLHHHYLFRRYHSHHHLSFQTQAVTGNVHPFAEHIAYLALFSSTYIVNIFFGTWSLVLLYSYMLWFDFMNCIGHCNWEFMPVWLFKAFPPLKYLLYTASFHSLHHTQVHTNFCLFMPIYDYLYGTVDKISDELYMAARQGRTDKVDVVFLTHPTDLLSVFHFPFGLPSFAAHPYATKWYIWLLYPFAVPIMLLLWAFGRAFTVEEFMVDKTAVQIWAIPRFNFHYALSSEAASINKLIESAILAAQKKGAKVICLGKHNKDEHLNASGANFVKSISDLSIRVVDGSTLTSAIVVDKIPKDVKDVFLIGGETKVGRAIATYLCSRRLATVKVLSKEAFIFEGVKKSVPVEFQENLKRVNSLDDARNCTTWIVGEPLDLSEQALAPSGTSFYQFAEESMEEARSDCSYAMLPAMRLPPEFKGLRGCEGRMPRGVVQSSHAGGILATIEGWSSHEVGKSVDVDLMDVVLKAAADHGFVPYY